MKIKLISKGNPVCPECELACLVYMYNEGQPLECPECNAKFEIEDE